MSSQLPPAQLPGSSPPHAVITPLDQAGVLYIVTALALIFALLSIIIRVYVRYEFSHSFGADDVSCGVAFALFIIQSVLVFVEVTHGLGVTIDRVSESHLQFVQKAIYASDILYVLALWITKASMGFLYLRLSPNPRHRLITISFLGGSALLGVISIFVIALRCDLSHPWIFIQTKCPSLLTHWRVVQAFDLFTEVCILAIPIMIISGLQMSTKKKLTILTAFSFRLLIVVPIALRFHYMKGFLASSDMTLRAEDTVINTQVELSWAVMAATIPCLRPFINATHTTWGGHGDTTQGSKVEDSKQNGTGYPRKQPTGPVSRLSHKIRGLSSNNRSINRSRPGHSTNLSQDIDTETPGGTRVWDSAARTQSRVEHGVRDGDHVSTSSHDSKRMMIKRDLEWTVDYEPRESRPEVYEHHYRSRLESSSS